MKVEIPKLPATFTGTGDLFTALLLAWTYKTNNRLKEALERTVNTLLAVLKRTLTYAQGSTDDKKKINSEEIFLYRCRYIIKEFGIKTNTK